MKYCSKCGYANSEEVTYCSCCGASLQTKKPEVVIDNTMKRCPRCGHQINGNEKFCASCGGLLDESSKLNGSGYKYCQRCGNQLLEDAVVCVKCGCSVGNKNGYGNQKSSSNDGLATAAKVLSILSCALIGFMALMWTFMLVVSSNYADSEEFAMLAPVIFLVVIVLIMLVVSITLTIKLCHKLNYAEPISTGFKVCVLLFVNMIAGILLLCMKE